MFFGKKSWDPKGKHCYITGGSQGLGLAEAILLTKRGAHVSIVARDEKKLSAALSELEKHRQSPDQILASYSFPLNEAAASAAALDAAAARHGGRTPDALFLCAGSSRPGFFIEQDEKSLREQMDGVYWVQAFTALAAVKREVKPSKIVFVSSILAMFSFVGYTPYTPAKFAIRGLAETLRSELILYGVDVHIYFPATILSPGYEDENKCKPQITLKLEETDDGITPEVSAEHLFNGVRKGQFHITGEILSDLFRVGARGASPWNNVFMDLIYGFIGNIGLVIWRRGVDSTIRGHTEEHKKYLADKNIQ
ncbi:oxidoreductase [Cylindrobasidium torrendii FP15055 ss-10]|uniref:3-dehydrosphinganine reductase n=1 Tax=Cylindrobasidium torrendii FP15055 ss-10 TaxID=1314674 RepID=A0A0D7BWW6_9AGAR|nr:oxidoreductase [Cylindrobasidium torrendii FP15055 ss-10]